MKRVLDSLRQVGPLVVPALAEIALDPENPATARVQAGRVLLDVLFRGIELVEIEERLRKLEQQGTDDDAKR